MAKGKAQFPARLAPAGSTHEWYEEDGRHDATVPASGIFVPKDQAEADHATRQGWPLATRTRPARRSKPTAKRSAKPAVKPSPTKPAAETAEETD